jgi:hypothetical protein
MPTLTEIVQSAQGLSVDSLPSVDRELRIKDQVVIRRPVGFSGKTSEVIVGQILAFGDNGKTATVSIPRPGGVSTRAIVNTSQLSPVTETFRRSRVQWNPAFRGQM